MIALERPQQGPAPSTHTKIGMLRPLARVVHAGFLETIRQICHVAAADGDVVDAARTDVVLVTKRRILKIVGIESHHVADVEIRLRHRQQVNEGFIDDARRMRDPLVPFGATRLVPPIDDAGEQAQLVLATTGDLCGDGHIDPGVRFDDGCCQIIFAA